MIILFFLIQMVWAHPQDMGHMTAQVQQNELKVSLELAPNVWSSMAGLSEERLLQSTPEQKAVLFFQTTFADNKVFSDESECAWGPVAVENAAPNIKIVTTATCEKPILNWHSDLSFLKRAPPGFELLVQSQGLGESEEFIINAEKSNVQISDQSEHSWSEFIKLGVEHIGVVANQWYGPEGLHLPEGIDHILFVIALVLAGGGFINILKSVSGFTLGHSITLTLATLNIVHVPSRLVESCIALSIVIVAAEALFAKTKKSSWKIATLFGLIHGLGFATALSELHLSTHNLVRALIGFNVGVEFSQAVIVCVTLPIVLLLAKKPRLRLNPAFALAILVVGANWFIKRAF